MSRSFSVNDSKRLSYEHIKLKSALSAGAQQKELLREETPYTKQFVNATIEGPMKMNA